MIRYIVQLSLTRAHRRQAYEKTDDRLKFDALYMGATAVTCLIRSVILLPLLPLLPRPALPCPAAIDARLVLPHLPLVLCLPSCNVDGLRVEV